MNRASSWDSKGRIHLGAQPSGATTRTTTRLVTLTDVRLKALRFIDRHFIEQGRPPTAAAVAGFFGLSRTGGSTHLIEALRDLGLVAKTGPLRVTLAGYLAAYTPGGPGIVSVRVSVSSNGRGRAA